jgi:hypothetical protein
MVQVAVLEESLREALGEWGWTEALTAASATSLADAVQAALALGHTPADTPADSAPTAVA